MSANEKTLLERIAELPKEVQDRFLLMAQGAAVAVECSKAKKAEEEREDGE